MRLKAPPIFPPTVKVPAAIVAFRLPVSVTAPVPRLRLLLPPNVKSPAHDWVLLLVSVMAAPLVLSNVPPLMVNRPVPMAVALLMSSVPADRIVPVE